MKRIMPVLFVILLFLVFFYPPIATAFQVKFAWDANTESDLEGYKIHYKLGSSDPPYDGTGATEGDSPITVPLSELSNPDSPQYTINLSNTGMYYAAVTAFNDSGIESNYSNEVSFQLPLALLFAPVAQCRIVDTRLTGGAISPGDVRNYDVYGDVASQGGNPSGCPSPKGEPWAVEMNVVAFPVSGEGEIGAYPANMSPPETSILNYKTGAQDINNSGSIKTCVNCSKDIQIINRYGATHLVIDVLGYYYPMPSP